MEQGQDMSEETPAVEAAESTGTPIVIPVGAAALLMHENGSLEMLLPKQDDDEVLTGGQNFIVSVATRAAHDPAWVEELLDWFETYTKEFMDHIAKIAKGPDEG
jgi:hypothetical protein